MARLPHPCGGSVGPREIPRAAAGRCVAGGPPRTTMPTAPPAPRPRHHPPAKHPARSSRNRRQKASKGNLRPGTTTGPRRKIRMRVANTRQPPPRLPCSPSNKHHHPTVRCPPRPTPRAPKAANLSIPPGKAQPCIRHLRVANTRQPPPRLPRSPSNKHHHPPVRRPPRPSPHASQATTLSIRPVQPNRAP
jgi:hypothetical protein